MKCYFVLFPLSDKKTLTCCWKNKEIGMKKLKSTLFLHVFTCFLILPTIRANPPTKFFGVEES